MTEVRKTAETGGAKGSKPERYDLIPSFNYGSANAYAYLADAISTPLRAFWEQRAAHYPLVEAMGWIRQALGGTLASEYHLACVYGQGAVKYGDSNWLKGYNWSWAYAAFWRHFNAWLRGEMMDMGTPDNPGTRAPHLACCWFHLAALYTYASRGLGTDDRPTPEPVKEF